MSAPLTDAPPRGTRPRDRAAMIVRTAARLFAASGFTAVSMQRIAAELNVRPSSLYRHTSGKAALLLQATRASLTPYLDAVERIHRSDELLAELAAIAAADRHAGLLWIREYRHLDEAGRAEIDSTVERIIAGLRSRLPPARDVDARARAVMLLLGSIAFHDDGLEGQLPALLHELASAFVEVPRSAARLAERPPRREAALPGREAELVAAGVRLFAERGYASVTVEQISADAGVATGSFYSTFSSKHDLLSRAFAAAEADLRVEIERALSEAGDPSSVLERLVDQYLAMTLSQPSISTILVNDAFELDDADRLQATRVVDELATRWADVIVAAIGCGAAEGLVRARAGLLLTYGMTLWPPSQREPRDLGLVRALTLHALRGGRRPGAEGGRTAG